MFVVYVDLQLFTKRVSALTIFESMLDGSKVDIWAAGLVIFWFVNSLM